MERENFVMGIEKTQYLNTFFFFFNINLSKCHLSEYYSSFLRDKTQCHVAAPGFTVRLRLMELELPGKLEFHKLMFYKNGRSLIIS